MSAGWRRTCLLMALALVLCACSRSGTDEEQIRAQIRAMTEALESGNARAFVDGLADDFTGTTWNLDQRAVRLLLRREMMAHERIRARVFDIDVEMTGSERARVSFHAVVTGGSGLVPDTGRWWRVETGWRKDGGQWQVISASWEPVVGRG